MFSKVDRMNKALAILMILLLSNNITADILDCEKSSASVEKLICSNQNLLSLNKTLNESFQAKKESLIQAGKDRIEKDQEIWLIYTRNYCTDSACLTSALKNQIDEINKYQRESKISSLSIKGKDYTVVEPYEMEERIASFNNSGANKAGGEITGCADLVDVFPAKEHSSHSFGGYCFFKDSGGIQVRMQICNNDTGSRFKMGYAVGGDDIYKLSTFTLVNCSDQT